MSDTQLAELDRFVEIADALADHGWWLGKDWFESSLIKSLAEEALDLYQNQHMHAAGIGRGEQFQQNDSIRKDSIYWLTGASSAQQSYLKRMEELRQLLNRELMLGLFEYESHFAVYEVGAYYKKHLDAFKGESVRRVSVVTYLNFDWPESAGGDLLVYETATDQVAHQLAPHAGNMVIFLSEKVPHEVLPCQKQRLSIAGWFRVNDSLRPGL